MNATELFNEKLPAALANNTEALKKVGAKFQFNIADAGEWNLDLTENGPSCNPGVAKDAHVAINISNDNFTKLVANPNSAMSMVLMGKLKIVGNQMVAMKLKDVFELLK